jgi:accessory colonization factor AcfC
LQIRQLLTLSKIENEHVIYRDCGIALTAKGMANPIARQFFAFVQSLEGASIFKKWGWSLPDGMQDIKKLSNNYPNPIQ